jgi:hypothetical protein
MRKSEWNPEIGTGGDRSLTSYFGFGDCVAHHMQIVFKVMVKLPKKFGTYWSETPAK